MIKAYYHVYLTDEPAIWTSIMLEQLLCLQTSGLAEKIDELCITFVTAEDIRVILALELMETFPIKTNIGYTVNKFRNDYQMIYDFKGDVPDLNTECATLHRMHYDAQTLPDDTKMLYFHTKGVTSYLVNLSKDGIKKHRHAHYWRNLLNWSVMTNWKICHDALDTYDTAGVDYSTTKNFNFYTGNTWWTKASHLKRLDDPAGPEWNARWESLRNGNMKRVKDEMWICSHPDTKSYDLFKAKNYDMHNRLVPFHMMERYL